MDPKPVFRMWQFYVSMSDKDSHWNHDVDACFTGYAQPESAELPMNIIELVHQGVTSAKAMKSCLKLYGKEVLFANKQNPPITSREFSSTENDLAYHIRSALCKDHRVSTLH